MNVRRLHRFVDTILPAPTQTEVTPADAWTVMIGSMEAA